mmetsp:Transcript_4091/g.11249  ORF Transcript_4091/g.11249 Transcript_4091/m.11249 type:complete len:368 (+) Transcript_4091:221-1324(+)
MYSARRINVLIVDVHKKDVDFSIVKNSIEHGSGSRHPFSGSYLHWQKEVRHISSSRIKQPKQLILESLIPKAAAPKLLVGSNCLPYALCGAVIDEVQNVSPRHDLPRLLHLLRALLDAILIQQRPHDALDAPGQDAPDVPPLQGADDPPRSEGHEPPRETCEARGCNVALAQISLGSVEARADQDEVGPELLGHGHQHLLPNGDVLVVPHPLLVPSDVDVEARPVAPPHRVWPPVLEEREEVPPVIPVGREVQDVRIVEEDGLRAVSVVDVPVDDEDSVHAQFGARVGGRDGDVVDDAVPSRQARLGVVARGTYHGEAVVDGPGRHVRDEAAEGGCGRLGLFDCVGGEVDGLVLLCFTVEPVGARAG